MSGRAASFMSSTEESVGTIGTYTNALLAGQQFNNLGVINNSGTFTITTPGTFLLNIVSNYVTNQSGSGIVEFIQDVRVNGSSILGTVLPSEVVEGLGAISIPAQLAVNAIVTLLSGDQITVPYWWTSTDPMDFDAFGYFGSMIMTPI
jgi:hypothetical protein